MGFIAVYKIWLSYVVFLQLTKTEKHEKLETCFFPSSGFVRVGQCGYWKIIPETNMNTYTIIQRIHITNILHNKPNSLQ